MPRLPLRPISVDTEFIPEDDGTQTIVCVVARDLWTGEVFRRFGDELGRAPFYPHGSDTVMVAYNAAAEVESYLSLGWPIPRNIIDLYAEHMGATNGLPSFRMRGVPASGRGSLLAALRARGLPARETESKSRIIGRILAGPPYDASERAAILDYCQEDVDDAGRMLDTLTGSIMENWNAALVRGDYSVALAHFGRNGHPVDRDLHDDIISRWGAIRAGLIDSVSEFGMYDENRRFRQDLFEKLLEQEGAADGWPWTPAGTRRSTEEKVYRAMAGKFPRLERLCTTQITLAQMKKVEPLAIGPDDRVRLGKRDLAFRRIGEALRPGDDRLKSVGWGAYRSKTGRNQPGAREFVMLRANWWRTLITPPPGKALLYCDWKSQEIAIAAYLSGDSGMIADYESEDFYIGFGRGAGLLPAGATKASHGTYRDKVLKPVSLGTLYGQQAQSMAARIGRSEREAADLLAAHAARYHTFWAWSRNSIDSALLSGRISTALGWQMAVGDVRMSDDIAVAGDVGETTLQNWPMQATGGDILRVACVALARAGHRIAFPLHDAVLIEVEESDIDDASKSACALMEKAAEAVLGHPIPVDVEIVRPGGSLRGKKGDALWATVSKALGRTERVA